MSVEAGRFAATWPEMLDLHGVAAVGEAASLVSDGDLSEDVHVLAAVYLCSTFVDTGHDREVLNDRLARTLAAGPVEVHDGISARTAAAHLQACLDLDQPALAFETAQRYAREIEHLTSAQFVEAEGPLPWLWLSLSNAHHSTSEDRAASLFLRRVEEGSVAYTRLSAVAELTVAYALGGATHRAREYLARFESLSHARPELVSAYHRVLVDTGAGVIHASFLETEDALSCSDRVIAISPRVGWIYGAWAVRGHALRLDGKAREAVSQMAPLIVAAPQVRMRPRVRTGAEFAYTAALVASGRPGVLAGELRSRHLDPKHHTCYEGLRAVAFLSVGLPRHALESTDACLALGSDHNLRTLPEALVARAAALRGLGRPGAALTTLDTALDLLDVSGPAAYAYLPKRVLAELVESAERSGRAIPPAVSGLLDRPDSPLDVTAATLGSLTPRQRELLRAMQGPQTLAGLSSQFFLSLNTLRVHTRNIYRALGVNSRDEAVAMAQYAGFFEFDLTDAPSPE